MYAVNAKAVKRFINTFIAEEYNICTIDENDDECFLKIIKRNIDDALDNYKKELLKIPPKIEIRVFSDGYFYACSNHPALAFCKSITANSSIIDLRIEIAKELAKSLTIVQKKCGEININPELLK